LYFYDWAYTRRKENFVQTKVGQKLARFELRVGDDLTQISLCRLYTYLDRMADQLTTVAFSEQRQ